MKRRISGTGFSVPSTGNTLMVELTHDIGTSKSPRVIVPMMHIYLEHVLELLLKKHWTNSQKILQGRPSYLHKLQLVYSLNLITDEQYEDLKNINNVRNAFAHSFKPKDQDVKKLCLKLTNHPYTKLRKSWLDMYGYSVIGLMSELTNSL